MADTATPKKKKRTQISFSGKILAGILLTGLTFLAIFFIIACWPNKMPPIDKGDDGAWYTTTCFKVTLIEKTDCMMMQDKDSLRLVLDSVEKKITELNTGIAASKDSVELSALLTDSLKAQQAIAVKLKSNIAGLKDVKKIHLNTILLLLVALMGFLGNMIHIASSFTSYVGNGSFKKSWVLWYFVKPFTAAGLAVIVYFIIRAGFLSYGSGASSISLYGILAMSALAGLFTDSATLKLKEVFEVIFKTNDDRKDKLVGDKLTVDSFSPESLPAGVESILTLTGKKLNMPDIIITIDGDVIELTTVSADKLEIKYTPTEAAVAATKAVLVIADKDEEELYSVSIPIVAV